MPITRFHLTTVSLEDVRSAKPRLDLALASEPWLASLISSSLLSNEIKS